MDKIFALRLGDEGLQFRCRKGVHKTGFGDDKEEDLGAGEGGKLVGLGEGE